MTHTIFALFVFFFGGFSLWGQEAEASETRTPAEVRRAKIEAQRIHRAAEVEAQRIKYAAEVEAQRTLTAAQVEAQRNQNAVQVNLQRAQTAAALQAQRAGYYNTNNWGGYGWGGGWGGYGFYTPKLNPRECLQLGLNCPGYLRVNLDPFKDMLALPEFKHISREEMGNHLKRLRLAQLFVAGDFRRTVGEMDGWNNRALVLPAGEHEVEIRLISGQKFRQVVHIGPGDTVKVTPDLLSDKGDLEFKIQVLPQNGQPQPEQRLQPSRH